MVTPDEVGRVPLKKDGTTAALRGEMLDFDGLNAVIGTPELLAAGKRYE